VLFSDLVGFTAKAQGADPEDVSRMLGTYHGVSVPKSSGSAAWVEKFIDDAAVGVWGVSVTHEDDAERAVRAALAILDVVEADVRMAVNKGEAQVRLDQPSDAEARVVGDVVNTASRLQAVAPVGGVLVAHRTVGATGASITC